MESQKIPILLNCVAAFLGAIGQYEYKRGAALLSERAFNIHLVLGVLAFCGVMGLFVFAYKLGGRISTVYPFYATTFVWGALIGAYLENEAVKPGHYVGLAFLMVGLVIIAMQSEGVR